MINAHVCNECGWYTLCPSKPMAESIITWHIYIEHRALFYQLVGEVRPPADPNPISPIGYMLLATKIEVN